MPSSVRLVLPIFFIAASVCAADRAKILSKVGPLPMALSDDFEFRKTKLYHLAEKGPARSGRASAGQDASIHFERQFRLHGAITNLDRRQRYGHYFDFFWRAKRRADLTVRLEYRQEKLHSFVQGREIFYPDAKGSYKTEFAVIGEDYIVDGRITAWRCLLIENGKIVAQDRSYMWE